MERVLKYKQIPDEKKVKLVALKLRKHVSIWWSDEVAKRIRKRKAKIKSWRKMREKLKAKLLIMCDLREDDTQTLDMYWLKYMRKHFM